MPKTIDFANRRVNVRRLIAIALLSLLLLATTLNGFYVVQPGEHAVVFNRIGGGLRESDQGIHAKLPFFESVTKYETRGQLFKTTAEAASLDLQIVKAEVAVLYHPDLGGIPNIHLTLGPQYAERAIAPSVSETVKATTAKYTAVQLIEERALVKQQIAEALTALLAQRRIFVDAVSITNFDFSPEFNAAIESKVVAQQEAEKANNTLARIRFEAQQKVIQASADREAANQTAQATIILAQANATAIQVLREQFGSVDAYLSWERLRIWNGVMPQTLVMNGNATAGTDVLVGLP